MQKYTPKYTQGVLCYPEKIVGSRFENLCLDFGDLNLKMGVCLGRKGELTSY